MLCEEVLFNYIENSIIVTEKSKEKKERKKSKMKKNLTKRKLHQ